VSSWPEADDDSNWRAVRKFVDKISSFDNSSIIIIIKQRCTSFIKLTCTVGPKICKQSLLNWTAEEVVGPATEEEDIRSIDPTEIEGWDDKLSEVLRVKIV